MPPTASGGTSREWFKRGSRNCLSFSRTIGPTNTRDMISLFPVGCKMPFRPLSNLKSLHFASSTKSTAATDTASSATYGRHFWTSEKMVEMPPSTGSGRILGERFTRWSRNYGESQPDKSAGYDVTSRHGDS